MKAKKIVGILCAASIFLVSTGMSANAADLSNEIEVITETEEMAGTEETPETEETAEVEETPETEETAGVEETPEEEAAEVEETPETEKVIETEEAAEVDETADTEVASEQKEIEIDDTVGEDTVLGDVISLEELSSIQNHDAEGMMLADIPDVTALLDDKVSDVELQGADFGNYNLDSATSMGTLSRKMTRSADSITQSFTDFITAEGDIKSVGFSLFEGEIFNATLACPNNKNLNYDLALFSIADDGTASLISASTLGTYIDSETGKTVDEGISYVHNQGTEGNFAIAVIATSGSSSVDSFTLTISLDTVGSYDRSEPNDSPYTATRLSSLSTTGSLHVVNDQDWYVVNMNSGVYKVTAGNYQAEIYYVDEGDVMVRERKAGNNYVLNNRTYFVKVFSNVSQDKFEFGDYTLEMVDQSKYATMETAFDFGDWERSYTKLPKVIPDGQRVAYYKFTIDPEDRAYGSFIITNGETGTLIEFLDSTGETQDFGFTGSPKVSNIPVRGVIQKSYGSLKHLVVDINGNRTSSIGYIRVTKVDEMDSNAGGIPSIHTRIYSGYNTFTFSGTAKNSGGSISNIISLNLSSNSKIPNGAVVDRISTASSISYRVGGVYHQLNPGGDGWIQSSSSDATSGDFDLSGYNIAAKQPWQFRYSQTALRSTEMSRVEMRIYWDYDINQTNYEVFK